MFNVKLIFKIKLQYLTSLIQKSRKMNLCLSAFFPSVHWACPGAGLSSPRRTQSWPALLSGNPWCWPTRWWAPPSLSGRTGHWAAHPTAPERCKRSGLLWSKPQSESEGRDTSGSSGRADKMSTAHQAQPTTLTYTSTQALGEAQLICSAIFPQKPLLEIIGKVTDEGN